MVFKNKFKELHFRIYDYLVNENFIDELESLETPFLTDYFSGKKNVNKEAKKIDI